MTASLVRVIVDPVAGEDEAVRQALLTRLNALEHETVNPILMRWIRAQFDIEVLCCVHDLAQFDDFVIDTIRSIEGVDKTSCHILSNGYVFPGGLALARMSQAAGQPYIGATVDVAARPGRDRQVFERLYDLAEADDLRKFYLFKDFASPTTDLSLSIVGPDQATVDEYVQRFVRAIDGVLDTDTSYTHGWAMLATDEKVETLLATFMP
ncbi:MAG: hypothetical protein ACE5FI_09315 [Anaerolineales bacterium]